MRTWFGSARWCVLFGVLLLGVTAGCSGAGPSNAAAPPPSSTGTPGKALPVTTPRIACGDLTKQDLRGLPDAVTTVTSAAVVPQSTSNAHEYCDVKGTIAPHIGFELQLPTATYRGRYVQEGCDGLCGMVMVSSQPSVSTGCAPVNDGSMAFGQDDEGHQSAGFGGTEETWAADPAQRIDFGYRSEHVFALAAKAVLQSFYGGAPSYSYYDGCSDGGREALMEAQRYPTDFNGIIAGAPAFNQTALNAFEEAYLATIDFRPDGTTIMPASKIAALHQAVLTKCADPGLQDQTIQDPRDCTFDPVSIQCPGTSDTATCLTPEQVGVVRKAYAGVTAPDGTHLYTGGMPYGSELKWSGLIIPQDGQNQASVQFTGIGLSFLRYLVPPQPQPNLQLTADLFTVENLRKAQQAVSPIYDSTNPDLRAFAAAGGKLIHWHGLADQNIPPVGSITYHQAVLDTMGQAGVDSFYRLYLLPGVNHCGGGEGPSIIDLLTPLIAWTENGQAPGGVVASKTSTSDQSGGPGGGGPPSAGSPGAGAGDTSSAGTLQYTRPVYPYPQRVAYAGSGDANDAANYKPYVPPARDDHYQWAGTFASR